MPDTRITVISFGFKHPEGPPKGAIVIDLRYRLYNPGLSTEMRQLTGRDQAIQDSVMAAPNAREILLWLDGLAGAMHVDGVPLTIAIGCAGGRHRSVVIADRLSVKLKGAGEYATHLHIDKPLLPR